MAEDHKQTPARKPGRQKAQGTGMEKRRNSCEARPGLIESTHIAPLNEGLMAEEHTVESPRAVVYDAFLRHSLR